MARPDVPMSGDADGTARLADCAHCGSPAGQAPIGDPHRTRRARADAVTLTMSC